MPATDDRRLDLVLFGATSFVGQILARHLVDRHGTDGSLRWAIAGRSAAKLDQVAAATGADVERIVVDASDDAALADLASSTRVVVSTVGPYALYGSPLVAAVAAAGTDYCDLTGEPQWMRKMIDAHSAAAAASGARIVHACGFDSIPSDLGVWFTQQRAAERFDEPCTRIDMRVETMKGGASGGTIASMLNLVAEASADPVLRKELANPYLLAPPDLRSGPAQPDLNRPTKDDAGRWLAPFVMAGVNTRVVHRSHALLGRPWGPGFRYREAMAMGEGPVGAAKASGLSAGVVTMLGLGALGPTRKLLGRVLPKPGEGPSPAAQAKGSFDLRFTGTTADGRTIETQVTGDRDPGYGSTAKMLGETAVAFLDLDPAEVPGGFWTTSTAFGDRLIERLEAHAGLGFSVVS
ncbi:saccharopine dehydrogenase family protein [Aquihabitans sp. McL0605]|uniref:saccharopine dehydrogenase family protein n=1 Tax=Aquihabitans sp. McL0605 TaxID=3415671 RepID=UPI003CF4500B